MATREENLKKINAQLEIMDDAELDVVVGGTYDTWNDRVNFINLGGDFYKGDFKDGSFAATEVENAFKRIGKYLGLNISASLGYDGPGESPNTYYLDGKEISRDELWNIIYKAYDAHKK